jgi:predicted P-loop ATPase
MPGVKADHMLILEGAQGLGKSTALEILASRPWFSDELPDLHSKDSALQLLGRWIVEVAEMSAFRRAEQESIKAFMSRNTDDFRPPYGMRNKKFPRQTVFVGTTNSDQYMSDDTGARRLWPVRCGKIDLDALKRDRDQIWAEVMTRHHAGAVWWLEDPDIIAAAADAADERYQADTWESLIARHISSLCDQSVTVVGLLTGPLNLELGKCGQREQTRVAGILRRLGWERYRKRTGVHRSYEYRPRWAP